ncbi:MAG: hypothetical protein IJI13_02425, partial [Oscillospiraceae bacterium]|nr:hypothetical protein [Oscillospiraceae bacterium]
MRKRLVSILFIVAMLFSLATPAFADAEPPAETPAAAEDAPAEAAPAEAAPTVTPEETPAGTGGGEGASADLPDSAPADENAPAPAAAPTEPAPAPAAPAAVENAPTTPAASAPAAADSNNAPAAAPAAAANDSAPAAAAANDGAGSPAPVTKATAAPAAAEPVAADSAGEANAEGGSEKASDASKDTPKAAASEETAGTEGTAAEGQEQSAAESAQGGSEDETSADGQKESSEEAGEEEKKPAEEAGEDEKEPAEEEGKGKNEPAEEEGKDENEPAEEEGKDENEPAEEKDEDLALGGSLTDEDGLKDAEQTEGGADADADGGGAGLETVGGAQAAGSGQNSDVYTLIEKLNAGADMTAYIAGMTAEARQNMIDILQASLDQAIKDNKPLKITDMALPDAEKYLLSGYDELLCWAATAANMLWTSNIAQQSVNPATNANFQTVDEVFDYFRTVFTDQVGRPDGALSVFLKGTYPFQNSAGLSQLKDPGSVSKRLPDGIQTPDFGLFNLQGENVKDIAAFEKLDIQSLGVLLHSYDNVDKKMGSLAHWVTSPGIIIDNTKTGLERFKAIMIADSDNDPINGDDSIPNAEKAVKAAKAPNSYTVYPLTLKTYSTIGQRWTIPFYTRPDQSDFDVLIDWVAYVASIKPATKASEDILPGDADGWDDDGWDDDDWDYEWDYDEEDEEETPTDPTPADPTPAASDQPVTPASPTQPVTPAAPAEPEQPTEPEQEKSKESDNDKDTPVLNNNDQDKDDSDDLDWDDVDWDDFDWEDYEWEDMDMDELDEFLDAVPADRLPELIALAKAQDGGSGFLEAIKNRMAEMNLEIFSPADWKYSLSQGGTFLVLVRTDPTQLLNVLLDGKLLTEYHKDFEVIDENTGTFLLVFSEAVMQS